jgi:hypothetical protein
MHLPRGGALGILVPRLGTEPGRPEDLPFGRAALSLANDGVDVVFVASAAEGRVGGFRAVPGGWEPVDGVRPVAVYDRFPSQSQAGAHRVLLGGLVGVPIANPPSLVETCLDKLVSQRILVGRGVPMPDVEGDPTRFQERLAEWGAAFCKPRTGSFGRGVRRWIAGESITVDEACVLQRAVPPPEGWAGVCGRVLVQRRSDGWHADPPVVRRSRTDPVVNSARGAEVTLLGEAHPTALADAVAAAIEAAVALAAEPDGELLVEVGVDVVLDPDLRPWVVEVNGRPRGRLEVLAGHAPEQWWDRHVEACARPLRYLAWRFGR